MLRTRPTTAIALTLIALLVVAPAVGGSEPAAAVSDVDAGTTWAIAPASAEGTDGRVSFRHTIDPGSAVDEFVAVTNFSEAPAPFAVYASDGVVTAAGNFDLLPSGEAPVDSGSWVSIGEVDGSMPRDDGGIVIEVAAGATAVVPIRIDVPAEATPGDHPAGVVAELARADESSVQVASRVGVRLHLRVAGDVVASVVPESVTTSYAPSWNPFAPGTLTVGYVLSNGGNVRLGSVTTAQEAGILGAGGGSTTQEQREILPRQESAAVATIDVWPLFFAWGEVTTAPTVVGEDAVQVDLSAVSVPFGTWVVPWSQLVLLVLLALIVVLIVRGRKRAELRVQARIAAAVATAQPAQSAAPTSVEGPENLPLTAPTTALPSAPPSAPATRRSTRAR